MNMFLIKHTLTIGGDSPRY